MSGAVVSLDSLVSFLGDNARALVVAGTAIATASAAAAWLTSSSVQPLDFPISLDNQSVEIEVQIKLLPSCKMLLYPWPNFFLHSLPGLTWPCIV